MTGSAVAFSGVTAGTDDDDGDLAVGSGESVLAGLSAGTSHEQARAEIQTRIPEEAEIAYHNPVLGFVRVDLPGTAGTAESVASEVAAATGVKYAERDAGYTLFSAAEDAGGSCAVAAIDAVDDPMLSDQYAPQLVNAPDAWNTTLGSRDVKVGIADTGQRLDHPDLAYGQDVGYDFVDDDDDPTNGSGRYAMHGTHVAGCASATTDNGTGVAGISNSNLFALRIGSGSGNVSFQAAAEALQWAADNGIDVVNMSFGGPNASDTLRNAVNYAVNNGTLPIAAAGNNGSRGVSYPARFDKVVAIGAIDENENLANFSQYGPNLDVVSPGVNVLSTTLSSNGDYERLSGTSMASPVAAGVAAIGKAAHPDLGPNELRQKLKDTAVDIGLSDEKQGAGRVDAAAIVEGGGGGNESPSASASASPTNVAPGETVSFDGSGSSDPDGSISSYEWAFGDGSSATGATAQHSYGSTGTYDATLTVTDDAGATGQDTVRITVEENGGGGGNDEPTAAIDPSDDQVKVGAKIQFDGRGSSDPDGSISAYEWDFDDGNAGTGEVVTHEYMAPGSYSVSLSVTDDEGASDTASTTVTVDPCDGGDNEAPTAEASASPMTVAPGETVNFDGSGSSDPDGSISSYQWDFGDGDTATGATTTHAYGSTGDYDATLAVTDDDGASDSTSLTITVEEGDDDNEPPTAAVDASDDEVKVGVTVQFDGRGSSDPDGSISSYEWDFDDGSSDTGPVVTNEFDSAGTYAVSLSVTDDAGATDTASTEVTVNPCDDDNQPPNAVAAADPSSVAPGETVSFDGSGSSDPDGSISSHEWAFGDGSSGTGATAQHSYGSTGTYDATLTVTDDGGKSATDTVQITVEDDGDNEGPTAVAKADPTAVAPGDAVQFDGRDSSDPDGSISAYEWAFGDGASATGDTTTHAYSAPGSYDATLTVTDDAGATDSETVTITVEDGGGGGCGDEVEIGGGQGSLDNYYETAEFSYSTQLSNPCQLLVDLEGEPGTDFDLYVTLDGRTPSPWDHDRKSVGVDSDEQVVIDDDAEAGMTLGVLVDTFSGTGDFRLTIKEVGK